MNININDVRYHAIFAIKEVLTSSSLGTEKNDLVNPKNRPQKVANNLSITPQYKHAFYL